MPQPSTKYTAKNTELADQNIPSHADAGASARSPETGAKVLFFSGGSALYGLSRTLKQYTHNSIHMITPFDSGGSSAVIRDAFDMPALGDYRHRMMALADENVDGQTKVYKLFNYRLPKDATQVDLQAELLTLQRGEAPLIAAVEAAIREVIIGYLTDFIAAMPPEFDLRGASIGNLVLAGGYLHHGRDLRKILTLFADILGVQGRVCTVTDESLHLAVTLQDGRELVGQHVFTGKETGEIDSPVQSMRMVTSIEQPNSASCHLPEGERATIMGADLICFPPGSFYSSLLANLLPKGVGCAICDSPAPKVFIPNAGCDPEQFGMSVSDQIDTLLTYIEQDCEDGAFCVNKALNYVVIDSTNDRLTSQVPRERLAKQGVEIIECALTKMSAHTDPNLKPYYDNQILSRVLLSLAS
ncbi:MAG: GAK system CofD-like protein [Pontibacterium sp.]